MMDNDFLEARGQSTSRGGQLVTKNKIVASFLGVEEHVPCLPIVYLLLTSYNKPIKYTYIA